ncbi:MAG: S9 family peptidase [Acidobacteria bacterium]|nr:S9 family peptidase [Acidobacteriota bacterium]
MMFPQSASLSLLLMTTVVNAAEPVKHNKANYELASRWTTQKVAKMVFETAVTPHWLDSGDRFWYSWENRQGRRFYIVDPVKKTKNLVFDAKKLAAELTLKTGIPYDAQHVPVRTLKFVNKDTTIRFDVEVPRDAKIPGEKPPTEQSSTSPQQRRTGTAAAAPASANKTLTFEYELATNKLALLPERPPRKPRWASVSPDDKIVVFARNHNLYMMDAENYAKALKKPDDKSIVEVQITTDGVEDFGYARRRDEGERRDDQIEQQEQEQTEEGKNARVAATMISWSKDSKKFAVVRNDSRKVEPLWVINSLALPRPKLETYRYTMPGEANAPQAHLEVFEPLAKTRVEMKASAFPDQTIQVQSARAGGRAREKEKMELTWAGPGSSRLYFARTSRDLKRVDICAADTVTGEVKLLIEERMNVYVDVKPLKVINNGAELIHWSERDGWGHYYLYDGNGKLKNRITEGEFVAEDVEGVDEKVRALYLTASGREDGEDPYYIHLYRAALDGSGMKLLDPGNGSHTVSASDSGRFYIDTSSKVNTAPRSVLIDAAGAPAMDLETVDVKPLLDAGFQFPEAFQVKADDGMTDLYGVMYKPFDFDPKRKYPIIAFVYPGPQTENVTKTFSPRHANVALAQLGFIVIEVGNRGGNPHRSKWYHTFGYGNLRDYGLADKKAAIEQLAARHPFIDLDRVGIYGHSGGGFMSTAAMLIYPDFFKVAVSSSGNHENNIYNRWWSEKHHGVKEVPGENGAVKFEYEIQKNSEIAKNLKGRLLLATGDIDNNVHPANTMRMVDALIKANKRFDMIVIPGKRHAYADAVEYFFWVRADYFAKHLLGDYDQSVDMWEINRERQQAGERRTTTGGQTRRGRPE